MRHSTTRTVFSYFNRIRDGRPAPLRAEIEPAALKSVLGDLFFLEMDRSGTLRFRLAGTHMCSVLGRELRGENFEDLFHFPNRHKMKLAADAVLAGRVPVTVALRSFADEERTGSFEMLLLPLSSRPGIVDRLFGCLADLTVPPLSIERHRILMSDEIRFHDSDERERQAPEPVPRAAVGVAAPSLRHRITQLRLVQGGRKD